MKRSEKVSPRHKTAPIMGLLLVFVLMALLVTAGFAGPSHIPQNKNQQPKTESVNLIPKIKRKKLKPGLNLFHTFSAGTRVWAKVEAGEIVGWVFADSRGQELPSTMSRPARKDSTGQSVHYCQKCVNTKDPDGRIITICGEIPCPK
jgi:hypothetical protein